MNRMISAKWVAGLLLVFVLVVAAWALTISPSRPFSAGKRELHGSSLLAASQGVGSGRTTAEQVLRCANGRPYYNYHEALAPDSLTLASLFDGRGRVQPIATADSVSFDFGPLAGQADPISDNRTQLIRWRDSYYAVERLRSTKTGQWNLYLFRTEDGRSLRLVAAGSPNHALLSTAVTGRSGQAYDAHIAVDYCSGSYDPSRPDEGVTFVMTFECYGLSGLPRTGGVCQSLSKDISDPNSWSRPRAIFTTSDPDHIVSGYPTTLWTGKGDRTLLYAAATRELPSPSGAKETTRFLPYAVDYLTVPATDIKNVPHMMDSRSLATCARETARVSTWSCNNRVVTDWKKEGDAYYVAYVGANYFDAVLPRSLSSLNVDLPRTRQEVQANQQYMPYAQYRSDNRQKITQNRWAFSFARVLGNPVGDYGSPKSAADFRVEAPISNRDFAGISSPMINVVHGRMYVYFSVYEFDRAGNVVGKIKRSQILPH